MQYAPLKSVYQLSSSAGIKSMIYARAGTGKTTLLGTGPRPMIFSAEKGLLSLRKVIEDRRRASGNPNYDIPAWVINNIKDLTSAYNWLSSSREARQFASFGLDSVSEITEQILEVELGKTKDPRQAYGAIVTEVMGIFRKFRDLEGPNITFLAKEEQVKAGISGAVRYFPWFPGQQLGQQTPYMFDELFCLYVGKDPEGKDIRLLRTQPDHEYEAKDRSGRLDPIEWPDLTYIYNKILGYQAY